MITNKLGSDGWAGGSADAGVVGGYPRWAQVVCHPRDPPEGCPVGRAGAACGACCSMLVSLIPPRHVPPRAPSPFFSCGANGPSLRGSGA